MLRRRFLGLSSVFLILIIALSVLGPRDFLGTKTKLRQLDSYIYEGCYAHGSGVVYHKEIKNDKPVYYLKNVMFELEGVRFFNNSIILYLDSDDIPISSKVNISGRLSLFKKARNDGAFDMKDYYNSLGLICAMKADYVELESVSSLNISDSLYKFSQLVLKVYERELPGEEAGFLSSVVLGNKGQLDGELKSIFQRAGLAHVLAVSGLHVSFLCMGLYRFLRKRGKSFLLSALISGSVAVLYAMLTGLSISSIRAVGMFIIYLLSQILGESYDSVTAVALLASILLLKNPLYISNPGFIFSFGATLAVSYVAKPLVNTYDAYVLDFKGKQASIDGLSSMYKISTVERIKRNLISGLIFSFGLTIACLPLVERMYYQIPTYSIFLNSIVIPMLPLLLGLGILGGIAGLINPLLAFLPLKICHYIIFVFEFLADFFNKLPFSNIITGKPSLLKCACYILMVIFVTIILKEMLEYKNVGAKRILLLQLGLLMGLGLMIINPGRVPFEIDVLDVGQGDGIFISDGKGGSYFIDGGSTSEKDIYKYTIEPFLKSKGVRKIDYWFVTHPDEDHVSGLEEALGSDYEIKNIVVAASLIDVPEYDRIKELAGAREINIRPMNTGDAIKKSGFSLNCVYSGEGDFATDDINAKSLCILLKFDELNSKTRDFTAFFGGDIGADQEALLLKNSRVGQVDFLKVSHHGSKNSSSKEFLEQLMPQLAVISCGRNNSYGHPHKETLERLVKFFPISNVFRTDEQGQIRVIVNGTRIIVEPFIGR